MRMLLKAVVAVFLLGRADAFSAPALRSATPADVAVTSHTGTRRLLTSLSAKPSKLDAVSVGSFERLSPLESIAARVKKVTSWAARNEVSLWRTLITTFFGSLVLFRQAMDVKLAQFWTFLIHSDHIAARIFRTDSYEWCLAISCFAVYIHFFGYADRAVRRGDERGYVHPWKKYRLQDRYEADKHRRMVERRSGTLDESKPPSVQHSPWNYMAWLVEFWVYALPLLTWDILSPRRHRRIGAFAAPSTMGVLGGIAGGLLLYDGLFFCGHWAMHKFQWFYRSVHAKHHKISEARAAEIVRLSIPEEVLEVGFSIVALNLLGVHPLARSIYNIIITFLLTELHCGFDFPWTPQNVVPFGLATGSRRHHYHHRIGKHYYQKFFFTLDRIFGHFQKDDGSLNGDSVKPDAYVPDAWKASA